MGIGDPPIQDVILSESAIESDIVAVELQCAVFWQCGNGVGELGDRIVYIATIKVAAGNGDGGTGIDRYRSVNGYCGGIVDQ